MSSYTSASFLQYLHFSDAPLFKIRVTMVIQVYRDHMVPKAKVFLALWFVSAFSRRFLSSLTSELSLSEYCLSLTFRVLLGCQVYQVSPAQKELEFLVPRFVFASLFTFHLHGACISVLVMTNVFQGDFGFRGLPGLPGPPGEGIQGPPVRNFIPTYKLT